MADDEAAVRAFRKELRANPRSVRALAGLGAALRRLGQGQEAEDWCRKALAVAPANPGALATLGGLLQLQGRFQDALDLADAAIAARPDAGEAWITRGDSLANLGRQAEAITAYEAAARAPDVAYDALVRIGKMHRVLGDLDLAMASFQAAIDLAPGQPLATYELGLLNLHYRNFAAGWDGYENRWRLERFAPSRGSVPQALIPHLATAPALEDLAGKRILLMGEQGVGDQIMFASMLPDLAKLAASVVCVVEPRLMRLYSASFPTVSFPHPSGLKVEGDEVDVLLAMGSLGSAFRRAEADFPGAAYLKPRAEVVARWAERLGPAQGRLRVGLSWRGGVPETNRMARSLPLERLAGIADTPGCDFVNLQYGDVAAELAAFNQGRAHPIRGFPAGEIEDFEELAALVANLDVVISVQTTMVHLAGALGRPCLALIPFIPEWRYMKHGNMPWYRSVELIRQPTSGDWDTVLAAAASRLGAFRGA